MEDQIVPVDSNVPMPDLAMDHIYQFVDDAGRLGAAYEASPQTRSSVVIRMRHKTSLKLDFSSLANMAEKNSFEAIEYQIRGAIIICNAFDKINTVDIYIGDQDHYDLTLEQFKKLMNLIISLLKSQYKPTKRMRVKMREVRAIERTEILTVEFMSTKMRLSVNNYIDHDIINHYFDQLLDAWQYIGYWIEPPKRYEDKIIVRDIFLDVHYVLSRFGI